MGMEAETFSMGATPNFLTNSCELPGRNISSRKTASGNLAASPTSQHGMALDEDLMKHSSAPFVVEVHVLRLLGPLLLLELPEDARPAGKWNRATVRQPEDRNVKSE